MPRVVRSVQPLWMPMDDQAIQNRGARGIDPVRREARQCLGAMALALLVATALLLGGSCDGARGTATVPAPGAAEVVPDDQLLRAACRDDDPQQCQAYRDALEAACASDVPEGCGRLASLVALGVGGPEDPVRARRLAAQACAVQSSFGCSNLAVFAMRGVGGARDLQEAYRAGLTACRLGHDVGCGNLATVLHKDELPLEPSERTTALRLACQAYVEWACEVVLVELMEHVGRERLDPEAQPLLRATILRLCQLGVPVTCDYLMVLARDGVGGPSDHALAARAARRACSLGGRERCAEGASPRAIAVRALTLRVKSSDGGDHLDRVGALEEAWSPCADGDGRDRRVAVRITLGPGGAADLHVEGMRQFVDCFTARFPWRDGDPTHARGTLRLELEYDLASP